MNAIPEIQSVAGTTPAEILTGIAIGIVLAAVAWWLSKDYDK